MAGPRALGALSVAGDREVAFRRPLPRYFQQSFTFHDWLEDVFDRRHTGPMIVHFLHGRAKMVEDPIAKTQRALDNGGSTAA